jgi:predicted porin
MYQNANRDATQYGQGKGLAAGYNTELGFGGTTNSSGYGVGANYTLKKFYVTAAYQSFKNETDNANATSAYPAATAFGSALPSINSRIVAGASTAGNGIGTDAANGFNITDNQMYAAATYDFGILKAYANYINRQATSTNNSNAYVKRAGQQIGVTGNITPKINAFASVGNGSYTAYGAGNPTMNFTAYQLGTNYVMSKRTNLYAIYGATQVSSSSNVALSNTNVSAGASSYGVGIRHTF